MTVTATGDTITAIQAIIQHLQQAAAAATAAAAQAEQGRTMAAAVGDARSVAAFAMVHQAIGHTHKSVGAVIRQAEETMTRVKAIEGG